MRTTLDIDADVLVAAKEIAASESSTAGKVLSRLARAALSHSVTTPTYSASETSPVFGFEPFNSAGPLVTNNLINKLRDQEGI
jgi:hypothetical protein